MIKYRRFIWPFLIMGLVLFCNIDWVVVPTLRKRNLVIGLWITPLSLSSIIPVLSFSQMVLITCVISLAESLSFYWFLGWFGRLIVEIPSIQEDVNFAKKVEDTLEDRGITNWVKKYAFRKYHWLTDDDNKWIKRIKRYGYFGILFIGLTPETGGRAVVSAFCRLIRWHKGFIFLICVDILKNIYVVWGWGKIFSLIK